MRRGTYGACSVVLLALLAGAARAQVTADAQVVIDWNLKVVNPIIQGTTSGNWSYNVGTFSVQPLPSQQASRLLSIVNAAIYETAVLFTSPSASAVDPSQRIASASDISGASPGLAASYAAHYVLSNQYPYLAQARFDPQLAAHAAALNPGKSAAVTAASRNVGYAVAQAILIARFVDGFAAWDPLAHSFNNRTDVATANPPAAGVYRSAGTPFSVYPQLARARPAVIADPTPWVVAPPPAIGSATYNAAWANVRDVGNATGAARTQDQTNLVYFWRLGGNTPAVPGFYSVIAAQVLQNTSAYITPAPSAPYSLTDVARLYNLLHTSIHDGSIVGWASKQRYLHWRPIHAVRLGDATNAAVPQFTPLIATPSHPEYPSTHSVACGAGSQVLSLFFGTNTVQGLTLVSADTPFGGNGGKFDGANGTATPSLPARTFPTFSSLADECSASRVFGGIHFNFSTAAGQALGASVATYVYQAYPGNLTAQAARGAASVQAAPAVPVTPFPGRRLLSSIGFGGSA